MNTNNVPSPSSSQDQSKHSLYIVFNKKDSAEQTSESLNNQSMNSSSKDQNSSSNQTLTSQEEQVSEPTKPLRDNKLPSNSSVEQDQRILLTTRTFGNEIIFKQESLPKIQESQDIDSHDETSQNETKEQVVMESQDDTEGQKSNTLMSFADDFEQGEELNQKSQGYKLPRFFQQSQERSVISNSQVSCLRFISQTDKDDGASSFLDDNGFDSRQSSQVFDRSQTFRGYNRPPPELLRSDSNFMFGPRYRTKAYDANTSPIKKAERAKPEYGKGSIPTYDDTNPDYDREEKERRKSLSRLSLSTKKTRNNPQKQNSLASPNRQQFNNEVFNNIFDSQISNINEETSNSTHCEAFSRNLGKALEEGNLSAIQSQDIKTTLAPPKEESEINTEVLNSQMADYNNWSVITEPAGEHSLMTTETFLPKNGKISQPKIFESVLDQSAEGNVIIQDLSNKKISQKRKLLSPEGGSDKENMNTNNECSMELEAKRCSEKTEHTFASPIQHRNFGSRMEEEHEKKTDSGRMSEEPIIDNQELQTPRTIFINSECLLEGNSNTLMSNNQNEDSQDQNETGNKSFETARKLTYMERKLKAIQDENRKNMGDFEFKKSYSKLEKEKLEIDNKKKNGLFFISAQKPQLKESQSELESMFMSDTKKHYTKIQLEKMEREKVENIENNVSNSKTQTINLQRQPLQMIQSEMEREKNLMIQESNNKSVMFTPQQGDKKRKYDAFNSGGENLNFSSTERTNSFKRLKRSDENQVESLEDMLANSKKKVPRIQIEKQLSKEREKLEKEKELKALHISLKDVVFKVDNPLVFAKEINLSQSTQSSGRRKSGESSLNRRHSNVTKHR